MSIPWFRELVEHLWGREADAQVFGSVLVPWLPKAGKAMAHLRHLGDLAAKDVETRDVEDELWNLFALSRALDYLLTSFRPENPKVVPRAEITPEEFELFLMELGAERSHQQAFHPFWHEIVEVEQAPEPPSPPRVVQELWPGFMLGRLVLVRAGVRVASGEDHIVKEIAERSTLYFTNVRPWRPVEDLSHGWGSNSQWRTAFRRDYVDSQAYFYNVDGRWRLGEPRKADHCDVDEELNEEERIELLRHRCFVTCRRRSDDRWPYDYTYVEPRIC